MATGWTGRDEKIEFTSDDDQSELELDNIKYAPDSLASQVANDRRQTGIPPKLADRRPTNIQFTSEEEKKAQTAQALEKRVKELGLQEETEQIAMRQEMVGTFDILSDFGGRWATSYKYRINLAHSLGYEIKKHPHAVVILCELRADMESFSTESGLWTNKSAGLMALLSSEMYLNYPDADETTVETAIKALRAAVAESRSPEIRSYKASLGEIEFKLEDFITHLVKKRNGEDFVKVMDSATTWAIMAASKQGQATESWVAKTADVIVREGMLLSHHRPTPTSLKSFWMAYEKKFTDDVLMKLFKEDVESLKSPRLQLTAQRGLDQGITSLKLIMEVMNDHAQFPWAMICKMFHMEAIELEKAKQALIVDPLIGFKFKRGQHGATKYPNIFLVARLIRQEVDNDTMFRNYKGASRLDQENCG